MSRECSLDAVATRNVVKVAIASKVAIKDALSRSREGEVGCNMPTQGENNPLFASLAEMGDECLPDCIHQMPTLIRSGSTMILDCIIECADAVGLGNLAR